MPAATVIIVVLTIVLVIVAGGAIALIAYSDRLERERQSLDRDNHKLTTDLRVAEQERASFQHSQKLDDIMAIINNPTMGVILVDANGKIVLFNPYAEAIIEKSKAECFGLPYQQVINLIDETGSLNYRAIRDALSGSTQKLDPETKLSVGSKKIPLWGLASPTNTDHTPHGAVFFFRDASDETNDTKEKLQHIEDLTTRLSVSATEITMLKNTIAQKEKDSSLSTITIQETDQGVIAFDSNKKIVMANASAERILGWLRDDVVGKNYSDVLHFFNAPGKEIPSPIETAYAGKSVQLSKWTFIASKTEKIPITGSISPLKTVDGFAGVAMIFVNAQEPYNEEQDEKAFFSAATHDLRTPLTTIRTVTELLLQSVGSAPIVETKKLLSSAHASALQLIGLVNNLLSVARIEQFRIDIKKEPIDIYELTEELIANHKILSTEKKLYLTHERPGEVIRKIMVDKLRTQEILQNLLSNAIKYTFQGGITISHRMEGMKVYTSITDTGVGINPENHRLLFRRFQQVSTARNQLIAKSTGLGLYIAKQFAVLMDGDLTLEKSEPGVGTTFSFWFPGA